MTEREEDRFLASYWAVKEEESEGWEKEHAHLWRQYYLKKLGFIALDDGKA